MKPRLLGHFGHGARAEPRLRAHEPRDPRARPRRDLRHRSRATAARRSSPTRISRAATPRSIPTSPRTRRACAGCFASSRSRAGSRATSLPRRRGRSMRAASSATRSRTPSAPCSTTPTCSSCASWATARPRPGALATSWHSNKFLSPRSDGAVLPILHLNGYKIANPTVLARIPEDELDALLEGYGWTPITVDGRIRRRARCRRARAVRSRPRRRRSTTSRRSSGARGDRNGAGRPAWPMLVLRSPKGWTGPRELDGMPVENSWRSHQVPIARSARQR